MPSFDIVSEVNMQEITNAVDQAKREISTRFDFKNTSAKFEQNENDITLHGDSEFQIKQMLDILYAKLTKRSISLKAVSLQKPEVFGKGTRQVAKIQQGIETVMAKKLVKMIKDKKLKVQAAIQGEQLRVTGKKRDLLQEVIQMLKDADVEIPLQFTNYRD